MRFPAVIATKGRAGQSSTISKLIEDGIVPILVVEPQERQKYYNEYAGKVSIAVLPENDQGITFARNFCLKLMKEQGCDWFWMLDDDIKEMYAVMRGKCYKRKFSEVLGAAESYISQFKDVAIGALEYQQYAWSSKKNYAFNSYCDVAVLINVERTSHMKYSPEVKEDRDFVLQALTSGWATVRTCKLAFGAPKNGSNKGGLHDEYKSGLEKKWSENMVAKWPGLCSLNVKKDGRPDVKIDWKVFKRK